MSDEESKDKKRDAILARLEIVDGLLWALDNYDVILDAVARAEDGADALRALTHDPFPLSEIQALHILDMTLRRRTKLSRRELSSERDHLAALI